MAKIATSKQTGGGGFNFEDKVSAYFLSKILTAHLTLNSGIGVLKTIAYQVRPDGWLLDDLLLTFHDGKSTHQVAVSAKSNRQISGTGLPNDILNDVWNQFLNIDNQLFDKNYDYLLFIVSPIARSVAENLTKLIQSAHATDASTLAKRIRTGAFSQQQQVLFDSFQCPSAWKKQYNLSDDDVCRLLSRLIVLEFDFQNTVSKDELQLIVELQGVLRSNSQADALRLYDKLKGIRSAIAPHGGSLDYSGLIEILINDFELKSQPVYQPDWDKIVNLTKRKMNNIPDKVGNQFIIKRPSQIERLKDALQATCFVFLTGKSGFGKSVITMQLAETAITSGNHVIWLDADILQNSSFKDAAGLNYDIADLIASSNNLGNLIIVDGADRFFKENIIENLTPYLRQVANLKPATWKMVITCQSEDYESLLKHLYRKNIPDLNSQTIELEPVSKTDLLPATTIFPQLMPLFKHDHLMALLGNLKYLDLIAYHIGHSELKSVDGRIGESTLVDWIWQQEITENGKHGYANSRFLQELASKQADRLTVFTPVTDFRIEESAPIAELMQLKLIGDSADRLFFTHDLFGDWARYKTIRSKGDGIKEFLISLDLASPLWGKAIRLYGIYLLEKERNATAWLNFFSSFSQTDSKPKLIRTLLLEAIIFSNSTFLYLEELWPELKKNQGELMNQFFEQFLIRGTAPDPTVLRLAGIMEGITVSELASLYRLPVFNYWFSVLKFIKAHSTDLLQISREHMLNIVTTWLERVSPGSDYRTDMALIAVNTGEWLFTQKRETVMVYGKAAEAIYKPMLISFSEYPVQVADLSLKLARRKLFRSPKPEIDVEIKPWHPLPRFGESILPTKYAPNERVDDDFRKVCLETNALNDMIIVQPELAKEILMAILIRDKDSRESSTTPTYGLNDVHGWFPPFYTRGPFLSFLRLNEIHAVRLIIDLTNIAAENWKHQLRDGYETDIITLILQDGTIHEYFGDERIYFWFRNSGNATNALVSALMALEKHLIVRLDNNEDITAVINLIFAESKSVSLLGLLSSLGRYKQELFLGVLKPLLGEITFLHCEMMLPHSSNIEGHQLIGAELLGLTIAKQSQEWHGMPHRRTSIQQVAHLLFFNKIEIRSYFEKTVLPQWIKLREELDQNEQIDPYLDNMIGQFDVENYVTVQHNDYVTIEYREPHTITEKLQVVRKESNYGVSMEGFAFRISQEIEKQKSYTLGEIEDIWRKIQIAEEQVVDNPLKFLNDPIANVFAAVAVILINWELLASVHPDYLEWAIDRLTQVIASKEFDYRHMESIPLDQSSESFQALVIPVLYKRLPADPRVREIVANFTLKTSYPVISKLFTSFGKEFSWTDPLFIRVLNLYTERCHLVHNLNITVWDSSAVDFNELLNPPLVDFLNNLAEQPLTNLSIFRNASTRGRKTKQKRKHGQFYSTYNDPGLDVHALYYAISKMPQVNEKLDTIEDKFVISYYQSLVDLLQFTWGKISNAMLPLDEYPTEFDKWIAFRLAKLFVSEISLEDARVLWQPLMVYGNLHYKWLEEFTLQVIYANMNTDKPDRLGNHWNAMIHFAFTQTTWGSDRRFHNGARLWNSLLGISDIGLEIWKLGHVSLIATISNQLIRWFGKQVANADEIVNLCKLLKAPCVDLFLKQGVLLVNIHLQFQISLDEAETPKGLVRVPFKYNDEVASMCSNLWDRRKNELMQDKDLFAAYKDIIIYLVARQNTTGLELQERLLSM